MPIFALIVGYALEVLLELVDAWANHRTPRFWGKGLGECINYFLPTHIGSLAIAMLIYPNENLGPIFLAVAVAVCSKSIFRVALGSRTHHIFNPSNLGIATTLVLFPYVGLAPPYHFTENLMLAGDWLIVVLILIAGMFLNTVFTGRLPLIGAWVGTFILQALVRSALFGTTFIAALLPISGLAFVLFTFYMITDPGTTPIDRRWQVVFGASVAIMYGVIVQLHIVFGLFFALTIVSGLRGSGIVLTRLMRQSKEPFVLAPPISAEIPEVRS